MPEEPRATPSAARLVAAAGRAGVTQAPRTRRGFLKEGAVLAAAPALPPPPTSGAATIRVDPRPLFPLSRGLTMQFMEPLGATDSAVAASWDDEADDWRADLVAATRDLGPAVIRFGGVFSRYYKWREGVGPPAERPPMRNHDWGGWETNRVGTAELADLCRRVGAEPLVCVNFMGDGRRRFAATREGDRWGDAAEAADWVAYANDPDSAERRGHGRAEPFGVRSWQIGNETSYGTDGFGPDEAAARTVEFARAMRARDPSIELIAWGDRGLDPASPLWAAATAERAGDLVDQVAIHMMQQLPRRRDTVLAGLAWERDPARAWEELLEMSAGIDRRLVEVERALDGVGSKHGIAVTEGHLSLPPRNANPILLEWLTGVYHAVALNTYRRHGDRVRIATAADFNGTRWTNVAVRVQVPRGASYLTPVGAVSRLFGQHVGEQAVAVRRAPPDLDVTASRSGERVFLHVANRRYEGSAACGFEVEGRTVAGGRVVAIAPDDLRLAVSEDRPRVFEPVEARLEAAGWRFPPGSVSVVELELG